MGDMIYKDQTRNLNPTPAAKVAMIIWGKEYSEQLGGSMDFWDSLSSEKQRRCQLVVEGVTPKVKALIYTPWPDNKVDYLYQSCTTENPFFDGHIVLKGEIYELHIDDEYHNSYLSLEEAKGAAQAFFNDEILDQIEV